MTTPTTRLVDVPAGSAALDVERNIIPLRHELHASGLFDDSALEELIDRHPREYLHAHHMSGTNENPEYLDADIGSLSGKDVLAAIRRGRVWLSVVQLHAHHPRYAQLLDNLYG